MKKDPKRKSRLKKTNAHLTISDVEFIRSDPYGMSTRELGGMFGIGQSAAWRITQGAYPRHLKSHFVARYS